MDAIAVVTGANSGIGLSTAMRLAEDGYRVFAGTRSDAGKDAISAAAHDRGLAGVEAISLDVTEEASVSAAFETVARAGELVSVLVNNAGVSGGGSVEEMPVEVFRQMLDTNLLGAIRCIQHVLPAMREERAGSIVNISSVAGIVGLPMMGAYNASKFALEGMSEALQSEVAPYGIRVVVVRPGTIMTPIWGKAPTIPTDAYAGVLEFLMEVITYNLSNTGVGPDAVADTISEAIAAESATFRHLVGDATTTAAMRSRYSDEELLGVHALEGESRRARYREMSGVDFWA